MKPAPFDYQAPSTLREAVDLLASHSEAFVIAGGQSLMPILAFRLATPSLLVDLGRLPGLGNIAVGDDGLLKFWTVPPVATKPLPPHTGSILSMALSADGNQVVTGGADKTVRQSLTAGNAS